MPIANSTASKPVAPVQNTSSDTELPTFQFVASWLVLLTILIFVSKSRVGYVIIYYSLLLMILLILVTEYQQIVPYFNVQTIGQFNSSQGS